MLRLEIESRLVLLNNKLIFEAYFSLLVSVSLGLPSRTYGFHCNIVVPALLLLIAFHLIHLLLDQLHGLVLIVLWGLLRMIFPLLFAVDCNTSSEFIEHIKLYILQVVLLEVLIVKCLHSNAAFELFDRLSVAEQV